MGYQAIFLATAVAGVISIVLIAIFKPSFIKDTDDKYRLAAGKPLDNVLEGRA
ncbi:MAG: hypothetical protein LIO96_11320 [Lachnospiraceae bacterium]|nr:hypothetical protein [Lachnospiraceae bacterium]